MDTRIIGGRSEVELDGRESRLDSSRISRPFFSRPILDSIGREISGNREIRELRLFVVYPG